MDRNRRLVVSSLLLFVWIFASAAHPRGACQGVQADRVSAERMGRFLLQPANKNATNATHPAAVSHGRKLPVVSIIVGSVAVGIAVIFLLLTTIGYFQNRWEVKVVDSEQHPDEAPISSTPSSKKPSVSNIRELES